MIIDGRDSASRRIITGRQRNGMLGGGAMNDISVSIQPEAPDDAVAIERLHERTFGLGRYAKTAYRLREQVEHVRELSFTARIGTLLIGSVWLSPIRIGEAKALLLGPVTVEPVFRDRGAGQALIERALEEAKSKGHRLVVLVGDESYYEKCGFKRIPRGRAVMPGPVDPGRLLLAELAEGAFEDVSGPIRPA